MYKMILGLSIIQQNTFGNLVKKVFYCKYGLHCTISSHWQTVTKVGQLLFSGLIMYTLKSGWTQLPKKSMRSISCNSWWGTIYSEQRTFWLNLKFDLYFDLWPLHVSQTTPCLYTWRSFMWHSTSSLLPFMPLSLIKVNNCTK